MKSVRALVTGPASTGSLAFCDAGAHVRVERARKGAENHSARARLGIVAGIMSVLVSAYVRIARARKVPNIIRRGIVAEIRTCARESSQRTRARARRGARERCPTSFGAELSPKTRTALANHRRGRAHVRVDGARRVPTSFGAELSPKSKPVLASRRSTVGVAERVASLPPLWTAAAVA
jgi:hypothetical protein